MQRSMTVMYCKQVDDFHRKHHHIYSINNTMLYPSLGYYSLCIDNKPSSFHSKLVSLYLASLKRDEWDKYIKELSDSDVSVSNVTSMLRNVQLNINEVVKKLEHSRQKHTYDLYLADSNNRYVQNWSLIHCVVVIACSIVQVIFVRKLFESNEFKKGKVRA